MSLAKRLSMKVLTIHQPWASLVAEGHKTCETRSWQQSHGVLGHRIAIHAARRKPDASFPALMSADLPLGAVICTAVVAWIGRVSRRYTDRNGKDWADVDLAFRTLQVPIDEYGDWREGRWIWSLGSVIRLTHPVPATGHQRVWDSGTTLERTINKQQGTPV